VQITNDHAKRFAESPTGTGTLAQNALKNGAFQAILTLVTNNTLLKAAFGLKLLHLRLSAAKSQQRVTLTHTSNLHSGNIVYQHFSLRDET
jgi:hypothetical protein